MKKTTNINEVIKEIKEYQAMQDELKRQIEALKQEAVEYLCVTRARLLIERLSQTDSIAHHSKKTSLIFMQNIAKRQVA